MYAIKNEDGHRSISERWDALEEYFMCITTCDINDQNCVTQCLVTHLEISDGSDNDSEIGITAA